GLSRLFVNHLYAKHSRFNKNMKACFLVCISVLFSYLASAQSFLDGHVYLERYYSNSFQEKIEKLGVRRISDVILPDGRTYYLPTVVYRTSFCSDASLPVFINPRAGFY